MKSKLLVLDDETASLLEQQANQSQVAREAIKLYVGDIVPDTREGLVTAFKMLQETDKIILKQLADVNAKLDYLAREIK